MPLCLCKCVNSIFIFILAKNSEIWPFLYIKSACFQRVSRTLNFKGFMFKLEEQSGTQVPVASKAFLAARAEKLEHYKVFHEQTEMAGCK